MAKVRGVEHERAQAASHIQEQAEEAAAREREIERMQVSDLYYEYYLYGHSLLLYVVSKNRRSVGILS